MVYLQLSQWVSQILNLQRKEEHTISSTRHQISHNAQNCSTDPFLRLFYRPSWTQTQFNKSKYQKPESRFGLKKYWKLRLKMVVVKQLQIGNHVEEDWVWTNKHKSLWSQNYAMTMCVRVHLTPPSGQEALSVLFTDFLFFQSLVFLCGVCSTSGCAVGTSILEWNWYFPLSES